MDRQANKLNANTSIVLNEFKTRKSEFENGLELNKSSDDPLDLWYQHIMWIWDNSEIVDSDQTLVIHLIEKCIENFASNSNYKNDIRFYNIFYKYTQTTSDPDDVYDSINSLSLFDKLSKFYISWSWVLINLNKDEKALEILNMGLEKSAEPKCLLVQAKEELESKLKEKKFDSQISTDYQQASRSNDQFVSTKKPFAEHVLTLTERRMSTISSSTTIINEPSSTSLFTSRLSLSNKASFGKSNTPNENLLIKSTVNRQGFEILEEDSEENRQSAENENTLTVNQPRVLAAKKLHPIVPHIIVDDQSKRQSLVDRTDQTTKVSSSIKHEKVKQNLIEKLKPLDEEPKIVIFDKLKSDQRFFADLKRVYKDNTEYSFEEIRMKKLKRMKSNANKEQSVANIELLKEIEFLKAKLKENEERDKEKESLQNQVDILKRQIEMIIANSVTTTVTTCNSKRAVDEMEGEDRSKRLKLAENRQLVNSVKKEKRKEAEKEDLTIVRDMWNATFASQNSPGNCTNFNQHGTNQRKDFTIFKDATQTTQFIKTNDFSYYPHLMGTTAGQEHFTIALPHDPSEFRAKMVSTPTSLSKQQQRR